MLLFSDNLYFLFCGLDLENDGRQAQSRALRQRNALFFKGLQARRGDRNVIRSRQNRREIKGSGTVRDAVAKRSSCLVFKDDFRCRDDCACCIGNGGADGTARKLREYGHLRNRQGCNQ